MIEIKSLFKIVFKYLFERKEKVFLTILGIIIGVFVLVFFIFLTSGLSNAITEQFSSFGVNVLAVSPYTGMAQSGPPNSGDTFLTDTDIQKIKSVISNYNYVAGAIFRTGIAEYNKEKQILTSLSYKGEYWKYIEKDLDLEIEEGRFLRPNEKSTIVLGYKVATDTFDKEVSVGESIYIGDKKLRVVGILKERGDLFVDSSTMLNFDDLKEIIGSDGYSMIRVSFKEGTDLDFMKEKILSKLNKNSKKKRVEITSPTEVLETFNSILGILTLIISFISGIALVVGGINILNIMNSNVLERINEISVMKALGAENKIILYLFLIESSIIGLIGSIIGYLLSFGLAKTISIILTNSLNILIPIYFDWILFISVIFFTTLFTTFFGTFPAVKAARVDPADNLRDE